MNLALTAAREAWEREHKAAQLADAVNREFRESVELRRRVEKAVKLLATRGSLNWVSITDDTPVKFDYGEGEIADIIMAAITAKEGV